MTVPLALSKACALCSRPALGAAAKRGPPASRGCRCFGHVHVDIAEVLLTPADIQARVAEVGK